MSWTYEALHPLISRLKDLLDAKELSPVDFTGAVLLSFMAFRKPRSWLNGKLSPPVVQCNEEVSCIPSQKICFIPELAKHLDMKYLCKKFKIPEDSQEVSIVSVFNYFKFSNIKQNSDNYINHSIVEWSRGRRPFILLHHIPTPMEVLRMQAVGSRVVTVFVKEKQLMEKHVAQLHYMDGNELTSRDAFEFLTHDLKHMQHFYDADKYCEQVGFFHRMVGVNGGSVRKFFVGILFPDDIQLWHEVEYVISDMNCYMLHLLKYTCAKLLAACKRQVVSGTGAANCDCHTDDELAQCFANCWTVFLTHFVPECDKECVQAHRILLEIPQRMLNWERLRASSSFTAAESALLEHGPVTTMQLKYEDSSNLMTPAEGELVRDYFKSIGSRVLHHLQSHNADSASVS